MSDKSCTLYPLISPQREIWFDQMLHDDVPLYNIGGYVQIPGPIDPELFERNYSPALFCRDRPEAARHSL